MGRRALRTGDMVQSRGAGVSLWRSVDDNIDNSDIVVVNCRLGTFMAMQEIEWRKGSFETRALILDSETSKMGWCNKKYVKRVE